MQRGVLASACGVGLMLGVGDAHAQFAIFNEVTDQIQVSGDTVLADQATFEAVLRFPAETGAYGTVFNEWTGFAEDKQLFVGPTYFQCYLYPLQGFSGPPFTGTLALTPDEWHHVAYVYDGAQQAFYVDGTLVASGPLSGDVNDAAGLAYVGAIPRDSICQNGFLGDIESLRISDVARYSGESFTPTLGDFTSDANTLLLYNFDDPPGSPTITDASPLGRTGTLGAGCGNGTKPQLGVCGDPAEARGSVTATDALLMLQVAVGLATCELCICDVDGSGAVTATDALFTLSSAVGQPVLLACPACGVQ